MAKIKVYVAGRMTNGGHQNGYDMQAVRAAIRVCQGLIEDGFVPYCPHLSVFAELIQPIPYEAYLNFDFEWIDVCHVLLRLPGDSKGADREEVYAFQKGIPVVYSVNELYEKFNPEVIPPSVPQEIA